MGKVININGGVNIKVDFIKIMNLYKDLKQGIIAPKLGFTKYEFQRDIFGGVTNMPGKAKNMKGKIINSIDTNNNKPIGPGSK